jgi:hypothetical protein
VSQPKYHLAGPDGNADRMQINRMVEQAVRVSFSTMRRSCPDLPAWSEKFGYSRHAGRGLTLRQDRTVRYFRSTYNHTPCYFLVFHGGVYVWLQVTEDNDE